MVKEEPVDEVKPDTELICKPEPMPSQSFDDDACDSKLGISTVHIKSENACAVRAQNTIKVWVPPISQDLATSYVKSEDSSMLEPDCKEDPNDETNASVTTDGPSMDTKPEPAISDSPSKRGRFVCTECGYSTDRRPTLNRHMMRHTGERPFQCDVCKYSTSRKSALDRHMRVHTGDKPFRCDHCVFSTSGKAQLTKHKQMHMEDPFQWPQSDYSQSQSHSNVNPHLTNTEEKLFQCGQCDFSTTQKSHFMRHMVTHTGVEPFQCGQCEFSTFRRSDLANHKRSHTGKRRFQCNRCDYASNRRCVLKHHVMKRHAQESKT